MSNDQSVIYGILESAHAPTVINESLGPGPFGPTGGV